ncbi:MAG: 50S ribosomal protein L11 methyltransferase [Pseudomonadota bacterium]
MPQTRLFIKTDEQTARALSEVFDVIFEEQGLPVSAFEDPDNPENWFVAIYCETDDSETITEQMNNLANDAGYHLKIDRDDIPETDWVAATLRDLSSVRAGNFIVHGSHEKHIPKPHEIAVLIDAGLAFGTGHHGTTAGCLDMLARLKKSGRYHSILDLGTGSGILAIAAAKALKARVLASDIDPVATQTAKVNVRSNGVQAYVECITSTGFNNRRFTESGQFDLVFANILAKPLQGLAPDLANHTKSGGTVILSGLLPHQRAPLTASYRLQGLHFERAHIRENWLTLVFKKP